MQELQVFIDQKPAVITANFDDVKKYLSVEMDKYRGLIFGDNEIVDARSTVANLRKVVNALDGKRKEVKKAHMIPYEEFEKQAKELIDIINSTVAPIDKQIKDYEENKRAERTIEITNYFNLKADGNQYVCIERVWDPKWISNIRTSWKSITNAIDTYINGVNEDITAIQALDSEVEEEAIVMYLKTRKLSDAITLVQKHEKMKQEILAKEEEKRKREEEHKQREFEDKLKAEEQARLKAIEDEKKRFAEVAAKQARADERKRIEKDLDIKLDVEPITITPNIQNAELSPIEIEPIELDDLAPLDIPIEQFTEVNTSRCIYDEVCKLLMYELNITQNTAQDIAERIIRLVVGGVV